MNCTQVQGTNRVAGTHGFLVGTLRPKRNGHHSPQAPQELNLLAVVFSMILWCQDVPRSFAFPVISMWKVHVVKTISASPPSGLDPAVAASGVEGHAVRCEEWHVVFRLCAVWNGLGPQPVQSETQCGSCCGKKDGSHMFLGQCLKRKNHENMAPYSCRSLNFIRYFLLWLGCSSQYLLGHCVFSQSRICCLGLGYPSHSKRVSSVG